MRKNRTLNVWRVPSVHTYVKWRGIRGFVKTCHRLCCLMSSGVGWHIRDKLRPMPKHGSMIIALLSRKPEGSLGRTAQDGHLTQLLNYERNPSTTHPDMAVSGGRSLPQKLKWNLDWHGRRTNQQGHADRSFCIEAAGFCETNDGWSTFSTEPVQLHSTVF